MTSQGQLSRAVSHALRHDPWIYGLELDDQGWVDVESLVAALRKSRRWTTLTPEDVDAMVSASAKQRYEISGGRIRALYGHSLPGLIARVPATPPPWLFHGTSPRIAEIVRVEGLRPMRRQYVHLSLDEGTAREVGARKSSTPVILRIAAEAASQSGVRFYAGNDKVWLADHVPARFIDGDSQPG